MHTALAAPFLPFTHLGRKCELPDAHLPVQDGPRRHFYALHQFGDHRHALVALPDGGVAQAEEKPAGDKLGGVGEDGGGRGGGGFARLGGGEAVILSEFSHGILRGVMV